ncbi:MAG: hypothetical protein R2699_18990 [Acidimicrobiales bacterium]|nr:hypothetical protein [Acidimicrobiales bacterium]
MSEQGSGEPSFRQSAEEKRAQETVMLNQDNLNDLVSQAKAATPAAEAPAADAPAAAAVPADEGKTNTAVIVVVIAAVVVAILVVVLLLARG